MAYLALGCPKRYRIGLNAEEEARQCGLLPSLRNNPHLASSIGSVVTLELDCTEHYLLSTWWRKVIVWDGRRQRVVLGTKTISGTQPIVAAAWSCTGDRIFAATRDGTLHTIAVETIKPVTQIRAEGWFDFMREDENAYINSFKASNGLETDRIEMRVISETNLFSSASGGANGPTDPPTATVTSLAACPTGVIVGTSSGELVRFSLRGEVRWRVHVPEFLRCSDTLKKMGVLVGGAENGEEGAPPRAATIDEIIHAEGDDSCGGVTAIHFRRELEMCGVVLGNGAALLLAFPDGGMSGPEARQSRWLKSSDVVSIALDNRRMFATLGLRDGTVEHYHIGYTPGDPCVLMKTLSLSSWHFEPEETGAAAVLRWSRDGTALAIAWQKRGLAIWSVSGCRMVWTLRQVGGSSSSLSTPKKESAGGPTPPAAGAVGRHELALEWGPRGYFLWSVEASSELPSAALAPAAAGTSGELTVDDAPVDAAASVPESAAGVCSGYITEMPLYRSGVLSNANQSEATRMAMLGFDRVMVLGGADDTGKEVLDWQHLLIPIEYIFHNWPPEFIAVNDSKTQVAVAAARGVAVCTISTRKWRLFGDLSREKRFRCCALAWYKKTLLIFNEVREEDKFRYELTFLTRHEKVSPASKTVIPTPAKPLLVDVRADGYLLVVCVNSLVYLYRIEETGTTVSCKQYAKIILPTREMNSTADTSSTPGGGIAVARIFPPLDLLDLDGKESKGVPTKVMLVRSTGTLVLVDMAKMMSIPLLRKVEQFWYSAPAQAVDTPIDSALTRPVFWAHGDDGVHVCFASEFRRLMEEHLSHPRSRGAEGFVEKWFDPDPEVYPLGVSTEFGMMLGVTQRLEADVWADANLRVPNYTISVKGQPVLHRLLRYLLITNEDRVVLQFALRCVKFPQFVDSLEWLLFEAVCDDDNDNLIVTESSNSNRQSLASTPRNYLSRVVRFLHYFGEYEDIVVRCARKMESKRWPRLFKEVGEPAALLELCYMSNRIRTAACLLVVIQEMWEYISATRHVVRLVEKAVETGNYALASELRNFLANASEANGRGAAPGRLRLKEDEDLTYLQKRDQNRETYQALLAAVVKHARKLLSSFDLRRLVQLAVQMDLPLKAFLAREQRDPVKDHKKALIRLHQQFHWIELEADEVQQRLSEPLPTAREASALLSAPELQDNEEIAREGFGSDFGVHVKPRPLRRDVSARLSKSSANAGSNGHGIKNSSRSHAALRSARQDTTRKLIEAELQYLMTASAAAGGAADDLALFCAIMLVDVPMLTALCARNVDSDLPTQLSAMLIRSRSDGYRLVGEWLKARTPSADEIEQVPTPD